MVHVLDASRSVPVAGQLIGENTRGKFEADIKAEYAELATQHAARQADKNILTYQQALDNKLTLVWDDYTPPAPANLGVKVYDDFDLEILRKYIDWTPFFQTWELRGRYPKIFEDEYVGEEAKKLFKDAQEMLDDIIANKKLQAKAIVGIFEANEVNGDVYLSKENVTFNFLRQQRKMGSGIPNISLADYVAPQSTGKQDYLGAFAVTAGIGIEKMVEQYEADHDDYNSIMVKALADRLAEAFAECLHHEVRTSLWGYTADEQLTNDELIREKYQGIRPAAGYPASPDHTEKAKLWKLLSVEEHTGISLTDSFAMYPAASVSGLYFSHPDSKYFAVGKISEDQVKDYAERKQADLAATKKWLGPNLF